LNRHEPDLTNPVFSEPWQAQVFALAVELSRQGYFSWKEWAATLSDELKRISHDQAPEDGSLYYQHWLSALERLVVEKGLCNRELLQTRKQAWVEAYQRTPHGKPVEI
jgi:nitrile hydratase accessory protein